jgi:L-ascorbate metabolism protein UlaG (beta-lactamase superfamily)
LLGVDDGTSVAAAGFEFTGVAAAHETIERDTAGRCHFLGYLIRFGPWTVYHSGDTVWYDGLVERLQAASIDVALLPINGRRPERRVAGNLDGREAARLAKEAGARLVIPCHYEMFTFNTASPAEFVAEAERLGQPYRVLRCGERWSGAELNH